MRKSHIILLVLVVLGLVGFFYFSNKAKAPVVSENTEVVATTTKPIVIAQSVTEHASSTYAEMQLVYPKSDSKNLKEINTFIKREKDEFWNEYGSLTAAQAAASFIREDNPYQLFIEYRVATSSKTVSYIVQTYQYLGGAHGGTTINVFTYDVNGKLLSESDVFTSDYLTVIAPMSRQYFYDTMGDYLQPDVVDMGTEASPENYSIWYLTDDTVTFMFGQYQVGPYVLGIQEFPIEKTKLKSILKPDFRE